MSTTTYSTHGSTKGSFPRAIASIEWRTVAIAVACYGAVAAVIVVWDSYPAWLLIPVATYFIALHGSFTHETIHGHPTPWHGLNELLAGIPLSVWIPYRRYRKTHIDHHRCPDLTCPVDDPESYFVTSDSWQRMGPLRRAFHWVNQTILGRLSIGTVVMVLHFWSKDVKALASDSTVRQAWLLHAAAMLVLFGFITRFGTISGWEYFLFCAMPATAVTNLRTFLEHRPGATNDERCAIVESNRLMGLLFLNNNLHVVHHDRPDVPWYRLPAMFARDRDAIIARNGGFRYPSYLSIIRRYFVTPKCHPVHPDHM